MKRSSAWHVVCFALLAGMALTGCHKDEMSIGTVAPASGIIGGNERVTIEGSGFYQGMGIDVYFGGQRAPSVVVDGTNRLLVTTPAVANASMVDIRVQTDQGKLITVPNAFRYVDDQRWDPWAGFARVNK